MTWWFKYVPHALVEAYLAKGWVVCELAVNCHHDCYSIMMEWPGEGEPPRVES